MDENRGYTVFGHKAGSNMIYRNKTHTSRWGLSDSYSEDWKARSIELMNLFKGHEYTSGAVYRVSEFGCGPYAPFHTLFSGREGFEVQKFDIKKWDDHTRILDLNSDGVAIPIANVSVFSGVLEYLNDVPSALTKAMEKSEFLLISYAFVPSALRANDVKFLSEVNNRAVNNGWRNHYFNEDLVKIISNVGVISATGLWNKNQSLFLIRNVNLDSNHIP